jgi:hypothetical protein
MRWDPGLAFQVSEYCGGLAVTFPPIGWPSTKNWTPCARIDVPATGIAVAVKTTDPLTLVGKREAQVPADRKQDHLRFKLAPLEQSGNRWDTEIPSILAARLSGQASKVATLP